MRCLHVTGGDVLRHCRLLGKLSLITIFVNDHMNWNSSTMEEILLSPAHVQHHQQTCILQDIPVLQVTCYTPSLPQVRCKRQKSKAPAGLGQWEIVPCLRCCAPVGLLCPQVKEPWNEVSRLHSIKEHKRLIISSQRSCRDSSLDCYLHQRRDRQNLCSVGWEMGYGLAERLFYTNISPGWVGGYELMGEALWGKQNLLVFYWQYCLSLRYRVLKSEMLLPTDTNRNC